MEGNSVDHQFPLFYGESYDTIDSLNSSALILSNENLLSQQYCDESYLYPPTQQSYDYSTNAKAFDQIIEHSSYE